LLHATAVAANFIHDSMEQSRSRRQIIILDSCFSGAFPRGMVARDDGKVDIAAQLGGEGRAILTATGSTQYAFEEDNQELSIYTRFLIQGIRTGDADLDENGIITIGKLHQYAKQKVREVQPAMQPEIHPGKEGFTIHVANVPVGDPKERYRKEVERSIVAGEISFIGRTTLDILRDRIGLDIATAHALEQQILAPIMEEREKKRQEYRKVVSQILQHQETLDQTQKAELRRLRQTLDLGKEDAQRIEAEVEKERHANRQKLRQYEAAFLDALQETWPDTGTPPGNGSGRHPRGFWSRVRHPKTLPRSKSG